MENTEKCRRYFEDSFFGSTEAQSGFTIFYEPQMAPRRPNEGLAEVLLPSIQWVGNVLVIKNTTRDIPVDAEPDDLPRITAVILK